MVAFKSQGRSQKPKRTAPDSRDHELVHQAKRIRYDLTALQAKTSELLRMLANLDLPDPSLIVCPKCGIHFRSHTKCAEHIYISHAGPEPQHWLDAETKAADGSP